MSANLSIDIETYSADSLTKVGAYRYAETAEIILFGFAYGDDPVQVLDLTKGGGIPKDIIRDIKSNHCIKTAFNAQFERVVLSHYTGQIFLSAESWYCTMVHAATLGFPQSLGALMKVLYPDQVDKQKDARGKALIRLFCLPNKQGNRIAPEMYPEKWAEFIEYNRQDVVTERTAKKLFSRYPITKEEHRNYVIDQAINDAGVYVDENLINNALQMNKRYRDEALQELKKSTGVDNPMSTSQFSAWLASQNVEVPNVQKGTMEDIVKNPGIEKSIRDSCKLRLSLAKTTVKKYETARITTCRDNRIRGLFQFYGAARTGRFAGRMVQVQNLARNSYDLLNSARKLALEYGYEYLPEHEWDGQNPTVFKYSYDYLQLLFDKIPYVLSELIRTIFIAKPGYEFVVADYHAIEAVVAAWLTDEDWVLQEFRGDGMIYEATAAQMFNVKKLSINTPTGEHGPNYGLRQKGKVASLAFQYGGGLGAAIKFGADKLGMTEDEIKEFVKLWRLKNPHIVDYWRIVQDAAMYVILNGGEVSLPHGIKIGYSPGFFRIGLPSGRYLYYVKPEIHEKEVPWGMAKEITYMGINDKKQWARLTTWGGKLLENITQAVARDILCNALAELHAEGIQTVMHVHDETINETPIGSQSVQDICDIMCRMPEWCADLPLTAAGFKTNFYKKD